MTGLGILSIAIFLIMYIACYWVDVLMPFFDNRKIIKEKIKYTDSEKKRRFYRRKYRYMKLELIPFFRYFVRKIRINRLKGYYSDLYISHKPREE